MINKYAVFFGRLFFLFLGRFLVGVPHYLAAQKLSTALDNIVTLFWESLRWYHTVGLLLGLAYLMIMIRYWWHWRRMPRWSRPKNFFSHTRVTVIIPARNEVGNIASCLSSLVHQHYPANLLEIIVVDDHSTDGTPRLIQKLNYANVYMMPLADAPLKKEETSFKKRAIELAISRAKGELIITTDADCIAPTEWIATLVSLYEAEKPVCMAAPVLFHDGKNLCERFQALDFAGMMAITAAGIRGRYQTMANGANFCYQKQAFLDVGGFEGIDKVASGDDILLAQKFAKHYPGKLRFVKSNDAAVQTSAKPDWRQFLQQRLRWASKSGSYREWQVPLQLLVVFLFCVALIGFLPFIFTDSLTRYTWYLMLALKIAADYLLLSSACVFFQKPQWLRSFWFSQPIHIAYIAVVGLLGNIVKRYEWKGRKVA